VEFKGRGASFRVKRSPSPSDPHPRKADGNKCKVQNAECKIGNTCFRQLKLNLCKKLAYFDTKIFLKNLVSVFFLKGFKGKLFLFPRKEECFSATCLKNIVSYS